MLLDIAFQFTLNFVAQLNNKILENWNSKILMKPE